MLELHIWGPAFGLPSIEPECIATVAYFRRIVPQGEWTLVADFDTATSPEGTLSTVSRWANSLTSSRGVSAPIG